MCPFVEIAHISVPDVNARTSKKRRQWHMHSASIRSAVFPFPRENSRRDGGRDERSFEWRCAVRFR